MARIQIADLHSENVVELTAEEQYLIQGGFLWIPFLIKAGKVLVGAATVAGGTTTAIYNGRRLGWW